LYLLPQSPSVLPASIRIGGTRSHTGRQVGEAGESLKTKKPFRFWKGLIDDYDIPVYIPSGKPSLMLHMQQQDIIDLHSPRYIFISFIIYYNKTVFAKSNVTIK